MTPENGILAGVTSPRQSDKNHFSSFLCEQSPARNHPKTTTTATLGRGLSTAESGLYDPLSVILP